MSETDRVKYLRVALLLGGIIFIVGIYPLTVLWPSGGHGIPEAVQPTWR